MEQTTKHITTLCYAAGKSGGHIIPCLTLATRAKQEQPNSAVLFFSSNSIVDQTILAGNKLIDQHLPLVLSAKRSLMHIPLLCVNLLRATAKSFYLLLKHKPSRIISTGGIVAVPVCIAGWLLRIPIDLYELNAVPGRAIKTLASLASKIYVCFATTKKYFRGKNCVVTAYPIRFGGLTVQLSHPFALSLSKGPETGNAKIFYEKLKSENIVSTITFSHNKPEYHLYSNPSTSSGRTAKRTTRRKPHNKNLLHDSSSNSLLTIFVQGGSQGSQFINSKIKELIETYPDIRTQIQLIHQTGSDKNTDWATFYKEHEIHAHVFDYDHDVAPYYQQADLIICRSGAGALFEALHFKKRCITIPLETNRTTHQLDNAQTIASEYPQLFTVIRQEEDVVGKLYEIVKSMDQVTLPETVATNSTLRSS